MTRVPIAVVGMGCRVPGADTVDEYWQLLLDGREAISEVPAEKWDVRQIARERGLPAGDEGMRWGGFLNHGDAFDAALFGIGVREAQRMDPQQGLLLEVAWQALEHGSIPPSSLRLREVGVYVGISTCDFDRQLSRNRAALDGGAATGTSYSICSNRISYTFGLRGPSLTIDAACSSSLVAIHLACQSLWAGETEMALAGGAHLILAPEKTLTLAAQGLLSPDGRCKSFSERANGYVRGEGAGIVVLMPWESAVRDGHRIFARICGSAINHNGPSNGLSGPSGAAQQALVRTALARAGVSPSQITYVEAHGLGMRIGDEIELRALSDVLSQGRNATERLIVGSSKGNGGHLEGAAGVAAFIKTALIAQKGVIPKTLGAEPLNMQGPVRDTVFIATEQQAWPASDQPRHAGVTSLSFGGANAHVVLQGVADLGRVSQRSDEYYVLTLSAISASALTVLAQRYVEFLTGAGAESISFADVCFTAAVGRDHLPQRIAILGRSCREAAHALSGLLRDDIGSCAAFRGQVSRRRVSSAHWILARNLTVDLHDAPAAMRALYAEIRRADGKLPTALAFTTLLSTIVGSPAEIIAEDTPHGRASVPVGNGHPIEHWYFGGRNPALTPEVRSPTDHSFDVLAQGDPPIITGRSLARLLAHAHVTGRCVDWRRAFGALSRVSLPIYPFERARYWSTSRISVEEQQGSEHGAKHIGTRDRADAR